MVSSPRRTPSPRRRSSHTITRSNDVAGICAVAPSARDVVSSVTSAWSPTRPSNRSRRSRGMLRSRIRGRIGAVALPTRSILRSASRRGHESRDSTWAQEDLDPVNEAWISMARSTHEPRLRWWPVAARWETPISEDGRGGEGTRLRGKRTWLATRDRRLLTRAEPPSPRRLALRERVHRQVLHGRRHCRRERDVDGREAALARQRPLAAQRILHDVEAGRGTTRADLRQHDVKVRLAPVARLIEKEVDRRETVGERVVPIHDQAGHCLLARHERR